jgi:hypothetical protein
VPQPPRLEHQESAVAVLIREIVAVHDGSVIAEGPDQVEVAQQA